MTAAEWAWPLSDLGGRLHAVIVRRGVRYALCRSYGLRKVELQPSESWSEFEDKRCQRCLDLEARDVV